MIGREAAASYGRPNVTKRNDNKMMYVAAVEKTLGDILLFSLFFFNVSI